MLGRDLHATAPEAQRVWYRSPVRAIALSAKTDMPEGMVAFINARILPMTDERVIERGVVVVERNRIKAVGAAGTVDTCRRAPKSSTSAARLSCRASSTRMVTSTAATMPA